MVAIDLAATVYIRSCLVSFPLLVHFLLLLSPFKVSIIDNRNGMKQIDTHTPLTTIYRKVELIRSFTGSIEIIWSVLDVGHESPQLFWPTSLLLLTLGTFLIHSGDVTSDSVA